MNAAGPGQPSNASKSVITKPRKLAPKIDRRNLKTITVKEGEPIYIDVKIIGEPVPDVTWYHDGKMYIDSGPRHVDNKPNNSKFYNDKPERKDTGTYKITATNKHGQDTAEIEINVICKYLLYKRLINLTILTCIYLLNSLMRKEHISHAYILINLNSTYSQAW